MKKITEQHAGEAGSCAGALAEATEHFIMATAMVVAFDELMHASDIFSSEVRSMISRLLSKLSWEEMWFSGSDKHRLTVH